MGSLLFQIIPIAIILFAGINWGLSFSLARFTAIYGAHPFGVSLWQTFIATIILFILCFTFRKTKLKINLRLLILYILLSLIGLVIPGILFYFSAAHLPAGILAITVTLVPIVEIDWAFLLGDITIIGISAIEFDQMYGKKIINK